MGLVGFRFLFVHNWQEVEDHDDENQESLVLLPISTTTQENKRLSKSAIIEAVFVSGFYIYWDLYLIRTNCPDSDHLISCISYSVKKSVPSVVVLGLFFC